MSTTLPGFHDSTLRTVEYDWPTGTATFTIRTSSGETRLAVVDCVDLVIPRHLEWGRSMSILAIEVGDDDTAPELAIEMQSGDRIIAKGRLQR